MAGATPLWTIDELGDVVARALEHGYSEPESGRVRAVPDPRTIRYYNTLGLLDRPVRMRGRTALYGTIHLLQIVAIKKLQAEGHSLAEIQARLSGASRGRLEEVAAIPRKLLTREGSAETHGPVEPSRREQAFWQESPLPSAAAGHPAATAAPPAPVERYSGVELAPGVTLLVRGGTALESEDAQRLRAAAGELLAFLEDRGITSNVDRRKE